MQVTTTPTTPAVHAGQLLGRGMAKVVTGGGIQHEVRREVDITVGRVLATGIRDIRDGAWELIRRTWEPNGSKADVGLVGFVRSGDTWDAVSMLAPTVIGGTNRHQLWAPWDLDWLAVAPGVQLDAIWQVSGYGFDAGFGAKDGFIERR